MRPPEHVIWSDTEERSAVGTVIRTPDCPGCEQPPAFDFLVPYFCYNPACHVVSWEPSKTREELADPAAWQRIDLAAEGLPAGNTTDEEPTAP